MTTDLASIEAYLHDKIPMARAMGVRVASYDANELVLTAPLALNYNHLGTAFGGSLSAVAMLAGYACLWLELRDQDAHVVVRDCAIRYRRAVTKDIHAVCKRPDSATMETFRRDFEKKGRARIELAVQVVEDGATGVEFTGTFVAVGPA